MHKLVTLALAGLGTVGLAATAACGSGNPAVPTASTLDYPVADNGLSMCPHLDDAANACKDARDTAGKGIPPEQWYELEDEQMPSESELQTDDPDLRIFMWQWALANSKFLHSDEYKQYFKSDAAYKSHKATWKDKEKKLKAAIKKQQARKNWTCSAGSLTGVAVDPVAYLVPAKSTPRPTNRRTTNNPQPTRTTSSTQPERSTTTSQPPQSTTTQPPRSTSTTQPSTRPGTTTRPQGGC